MTKLTLKPNSNGNVNFTPNLNINVLSVEQ